MSIQHLVQNNSKKFPLYCSSIVPFQKKINLAASRFTATAGTPIVSFPIQGINFEGTTALGSAILVQFKFQHISGVIGATTVKLTSSDSLTTYFSATMPMLGESTITLAAGTALPTSEANLLLQFSTDATANSIFIPLCFIMNFY